MKPRKPEMYPESMDILERCGIVTKMPTIDAPWRSALVTIFGAEHYVLGTKTVAAKLVHDETGYRLVFKNSTGVPASELINNYSVATVHDVEVKFEDTPGLSMAKMRPGEYPAVLRDQDILRIS